MGEVSSKLDRDTSNEAAFLRGSQDNTNLWKVTLMLNGVPVDLKIDTGAEVSVIPESCTV